MRTLRPRIARLPIEDLVIPIREILGYTVNTWSGLDPHDVVMWVAEYVLGIHPGGLATLEAQLVNSWGVSPARARAVICHVLFPLDHALKTYTECIAAQPSTVKLAVFHQELRIEIYPISTGE